MRIFYLSAAYSRCAPANSWVRWYTSRCSLIVFVTKRSSQTTTKA